MNNIHKNIFDANRNVVPQNYVAYTRPTDVRDCDGGRLPLDLGLDAVG